MQLLYTTVPSSIRSSYLVPTRTFIRPVLDARQLGSVSLLEIKKFLRQKCLEFGESHACLSIQIPKHLITASELPSRWKSLDIALVKIFINKTTGGYVCPELGFAGDWKNLQDFLIVYTRNRTAKRGDPAQPLPSLSPLDLKASDQVQTLWQQSCPIESLEIKEFKDLLKLFKLPVRDLKLEDFVRFEVRVADNELLFPVRYIDGRLIGLRRVFVCPDTAQPAEENIPAEPTTHGVLPFPHGLDLASSSQAVVLVASVLDSVVIAAKTRQHAIALAAGSSALPPDHLPYLEQFSRVTLWFPNDVPSADSARTFAKKLGEKRCQMISREVANPSVSLKRKEDIAHVLKFQAKPCCHEYITTFETLREDVFLEMAHYEEVEGTKFKRFEALNEMLRGFRRGELTVFTGKTGSGKTTFLSEYSLDLCMQGINTLWGSFEVKNTRLAKMQLKQFSTVNLEDDLDQFDLWADRFQKLPMYYLTFHGSQEIEVILDAMGHAVYIYDIAHIIIDNLQFMMGTSSRVMDRFYAQDLIIQKFRKFATLHNVHVTLVIHPRKEDDERLTANSIFGGAKATQEADNVILLQEEELNARTKRKFVQVVKNRFSGDLGIMPLFFNKGTLTFSKKTFMREKNLKKRKEVPKSQVTGEIEDMPNEILIPPDKH